MLLVLLGCYQTLQIEIVSARKESGGDAPSEVLREPYDFIGLDLRHIHIENLNDKALKAPFERVGTKS